MSEAQQFFFAECAAHARRLPLTDAAKFLRGCLESCETAVSSPLQKVYLAVSESDKQLDLIQHGQLKLNLEPQKPSRPHKHNHDHQ